MRMWMVCLVLLISLQARGQTASVPADAGRDAGVAAVGQNATDSATNMLAGAWQRSDIGETLIVPMAAAPYPHESRADGFTIRDKTYPRDPHYVDSSVALFIPAGYTPGDTVDLLIYFHGHLNNIRKAMDVFKLREQAAAAGKNVILVFPEGPKDAEDSGGGKLEEQGGFKRLADEVLDKLVAENRITHRRLGRVLIAGHSGAYRVISYCIERGGLEAQISDVCLLDATYARLDAFVDWLVRRPRARLFSIFTNHLAPENVYLMTHLRHRGIPYELLDEADVPDDLVRLSRVLFLHASKLSHDQTVRWLERWLRSTSLPDLTSRSSSQPAAATK